MSFTHVTNEKCLRSFRSLLVEAIFPLWFSQRASLKLNMIFRKSELLQRHERNKNLRQIEGMRLQGTKEMRGQRKCAGKRETAAKPASSQEKAVNQSRYVRGKVFTLGQFRFLLVEAVFFSWFSQRASLKLKTIFRKSELLQRHEWNKNLRQIEGMRLQGIKEMRGQRKCAGKRETAAKPASSQEKAVNQSRYMRGKVFAL